MLKKTQQVALAFTLLQVAPVFANYGQGLWLFGGAGLGIVSLKSSESNPSTLGQVNPGRPEQDKLGYSFHVKAGPSWYINPSFVADAMLGWDYSKISGKAEQSGDEDVSISHQLGFFSLSPRYRFGETGRWQLGPLYKLKFGTDTSYTEREGQNINEKPMTHYLGLHLNWDIPSESQKTIYRVGFEPMIDLSNPRTIITANLLFEIGFRLFGDESAPITTHQEETNEVISAAPEENLVEESEEMLPEDDNAVSAKAKGNVVFIRFPSDRFLFATGMSHIGVSETREYLKELGEFLATNEESWDRGIVVGHTDRRGPKGREREVNQELSTARAETVKQALIKAGVSAKKLSSYGKAFDEPVPGAADNAEGWRKNRRVELSFEGVNAPDHLIGEINRLNRKYGFGNQRF